MGYRCIVLAKQVPDTKNITGQAMNEDGTVNRAALPKIFNPEDLSALEAALAIRDRHGGSVTVITMGPPSANEVLREALYRGADDAVLLTDRRFAVADTLATSYTLGQAIRTLGDFDLVLCGRQAIDGDTAQVGPQTAEKLGVPQVAYVQEIEWIGDGRLRARRQIEGGVEVVETTLPALLTVTDDFYEPRPPRAKRLMQFKAASSPSELAERIRAEAEARGEKISREAAAALAEQRAAALERRGLRLKEWNVEAIGADPDRCGMKGSPTRVKKIDFVTLVSTELRMIEPTEAGVGALVGELVRDHILD